MPIRTERRQGPRGALAGRWCLVALGTALVLLAVTGCVGGEAASMPRVTVELGGEQSADLSPTVQVLLLLTGLALAPTALLMTTSFTRIVIVLSMLRSAIGVPQLPPGPLLLGLSLMLTVFIMRPTWEEAYRGGLGPYLAGELGQEEAFAAAQAPLRRFMFRQVRERDLALFVELARLERPRTEEDIPTYVLVPAFALSELRAAFQMGVLLFIPFLVIDLVVASVLMTLGMMMLPPTVVSLPFKLLLFVLVDGWTLVVGSLVRSFV